MQRRVGVRPRGHPQGSDHEESKRWRKRDSAPIPANSLPVPFITLRSDRNAEGWST